MTIWQMLWSAAGLMIWTAAVIGGCFIGAAPFVAWQEYKALRKERDGLREQHEQLWAEIRRLRGQDS